MAEIKITELNELSLANLNDNDVFPIVDVSEDETKKVKLMDIKPAVKDSYSQSTADPYSAHYVNAHFVPVQLYNNASGTTSQITLSDSCANYTYVVIQAIDNNGYYYQDTVVYSPNNKTINITETIDQYCKYGRITFANNKINFNKNHQYNSSNEREDDGDFCKITKVMGFKL